MSKKILNNHIIIIVIFMLFLCGCDIKGCIPENKVYQSKDYIIKVGSKKLTEEMFYKILDFTKTEYASDIINNAKALKAVKVHLLIELTEELVLLQKAEEMRITVPDKELEKAIDDIIKDYPEKSLFEEMFIKSAVSYKLWKARLKNRLIIDKVIKSELFDKVEIKPEDIKKYYEETYLKNIIPNSEEDHLAVNSQVAEQIIINLKNQKAEKAYDKWIEKIKNQYTIEINEVQWKKLLENGS
jgi:hypothetical protein